MFSVAHSTMFPLGPKPTTSVFTTARTHSISGLKSRVLKVTFLALNMMVKSGLEFILKFTEPLQRYLQLDARPIRPFWADVFARSSNSEGTRDFSQLIKRVLAGVC